MSALWLLAVTIMTAAVGFDDFNISPLKATSQNRAVVGDIVDDEEARM